MIKIKVVDLQKLYNFVVEFFSISITFPKVKYQNIREKAK
jgi:hypothetical protein